MKNDNTTLRWNDLVVRWNEADEAPELPEEIAQNESRNMVYVAVFYKYIGASVQPTFEKMAVVQCEQAFKNMACKWFVDNNPEKSHETMMFIYYEHAIEFYLTDDLSKRLIMTLFEL